MAYFYPMAYFYGAGVKRYIEGTRYKALVRPLSHKDESSTAPHVLFLIRNEASQTPEGTELPPELLPYQGRRYANRGSGVAAARRLEKAGRLS
jgi:hypothetical protein